MQAQKGEGDKTMEAIRQIVSFKRKIRELKEAMRDDLFLDDLRETSENFKAVDLSNKDS